MRERLQPHAARVSVEYVHNHVIVVARIQQEVQTYGYR